MDFFFSENWSIIGLYFDQKSIFLPIFLFWPDLAIPSVPSAPLESSGASVRDPYIPITQPNIVTLMKTSLESLQ